MFQHKSVNRANDNTVSLNYARKMQDDNRRATGTTANAAADKMDEEKSSNAATGNLEEEKSTNAVAEKEEEKAMNSLYSSNITDEEKRSKNAAGEKEEKKTMNSLYSSNMADEEKKTMNAAGDKVDEEKNMNAAEKMDEEKTSNSAGITGLSIANQVAPSGNQSQGKALAKAGASAAKILKHYLDPPPAPNLKVTIGKVNSTFGKPGVNRIPPRTDTDVAVKVSGVPADHPGVMFKINKTNVAGDGAATINGRSHAFVKNDTTLKLRGTEQTTPGNANGLCLAALEKLGSKTALAASNHFSVAAYPKSAESTFLNTNYTPTPSQTTMGASYKLTYHSDSGVDSDLDKAWVSERVAVSPMETTGILRGGQTNSTFLPATSTQVDNNNYFPSYSPAAFRTLLATGTNLSSKRTDLQWFVLGCERTDLGHADSDVRSAPVIPASGFSLKRSFSKDVSGNYFFHIQRITFANNGAGAGIAADTGIKTIPIV